jgi:predicted MFS family arabinose efflux permease
VRQLEHPGRFRRAVPGTGPKVAPVPVSPVPPVPPVPAAVWLTALGAVVVGTDAYLIAGILPGVADGLHVSVSAAGQLITVFALVYAIAAPLTATATTALGRRTVLTGALAVFAAGVLVTAGAPDYAWALAGRVLAAVGASCFTPQAAASAVLLVGEQRRARALSVVVGGFTVASVLGVPLGTAVAGLIGWRGTLVAVAILALLTGVGVALGFPTVAPQQAYGLRDRLRGLRNPAVLTTLVVSLLTASSEQVVYSYIGPVLGPVTDHRSQLLAVLLCVAGVGGILGNVLAGGAVQRYGARTTMLVAVTGMVATLAVLPWWSHNLPAAAAALFCWGLTGWAYVVPQQHRLVELDPGRMSVTIALNSSAFYLGIGIGSLLGGAVLHYLTPAALAVPTLILGLAAVLTTIFGYRD